MKVRDLIKALLDEAIDPDWEVTITCGRDHRFQSGEYTVVGANAFAGTVDLELATERELSKP